MALFKDWQDFADKKSAEPGAEQYWTQYFLREKDFYEKLLKGEAPKSGTVQAVCISLGQPISSSAIPAKADDKDTLIFPADLTGSMEMALGSQKLQLETGLTNTDLFKEIYKSLKKKKPVIALMLVADAESAKLQYGVVTGLDVSNNRVTVALSEGVDTYTLAEFVAATRFENTKNIPLRLRFSLLFGTLSRNTAIFLK